MKQSFLAVLLLLLPTPGQAESPPQYDSEAHCKEVAGFGGSYSAFMDNACLAQEQSAYDSLKANWADLPTDARSHCDEVARFGGQGSYFMLQACMQQEMQARASRPKFRR